MKIENKTSYKGPTGFITRLTRGAGSSESQFNIFITHQDISREGEEDDWWGFRSYETVGLALSAVKKHFAGDAWSGGNVKCNITIYPNRDRHGNWLGNFRVGIEWI